jgi:hypothetical protein
MSDRPLWRCPACGREFANRNQVHTCAPPGDLDERLAGLDPGVLAVFTRFRALVEACGPVRILPERTRIAFATRMSFAAVMPRRRWLDGHLVLARRDDSPRWRRVETFSARNHLHAFRFTTPEELDDEVAAWIAEAYEVGRQRHLRS